MEEATPYGKAVLKPTSRGGQRGAELKREGEGT